MRIIDGRVVPPAKGAVASALSPTGYLSDYQELYRARDEADFLRDSPRLQGTTFREAVLALLDQPLSAFLGFLEDAGIEQVICAAIDVRSAQGRHLPNEVVGELVAQCPERIVGLAGVDPRHGMAAVRELERAVKDLGLRGANFNPWELRMYPTDRLFYPLYAKCVELGVCVSLHASVSFGPSRRMDYSHVRYIDEVASDFPELRMIANHGGWPWVEDLVALCWRNRNVFICTSNVRPRYLADADTGWRPLLRYGHTVIQDQVIWGSGWPALPFRRTIEEVEALPLKPSVKQKWLGLNALRLFDRA
ncbi:MAG: amidohydrolase [Chloroflexi bacterium]|nr:amidohydrolase [Chloroflexota bacterium]